MPGSSTKAFGLRFSLPDVLLLTLGMAIAAALIATWFEYERRQFQWTRQWPGNATFVETIGTIIVLGLLVTSAIAVVFDRTTGRQKGPIRAHEWLWLAPFAWFGITLSFTQLAIYFLGESESIGVLLLLGPPGLSGMGVAAVADILLLCRGKHRLVEFLSPLALLLFPLWVAYVIFLCPVVST